ncbi:MAG: uroporphyrinogen-III C-methyltransferase, partial [Devosia sp.]|nr:uroporphyrinogen-III C-methyltransferase [Devosia sp.]
MGELNTFPVSYKVKGKRIVIVGGGEEALNKARLAIMTTASVVIISEAISSKELYEVGAEIVGRFETSVLDDTALV